MSDLILAQLRLVLRSPLYNTQVSSPVRKRYTCLWPLCGVKIPLYAAQPLLPLASGFFDAPIHAPVCYAMLCDVMKYAEKSNRIKSPIIPAEPHLPIVMSKSTVISLQTLAFLPELADDSLEIGMILVL